MGKIGMLVVKLVVPVGDYCATENPESLLSLKGNWGHVVTVERLEFIDLLYWKPVPTKGSKGDAIVADIVASRRGN
jgi:hypothetical protein